MCGGKGLGECLKCVLSACLPAKLRVPDPYISAGKQVDVSRCLCWGCTRVVWSKPFEGGPRIFLTAGAEDAIDAEWNATSLLANVAASEHGRGKGLRDILSLLLQCQLIDLLTHSSCLCSCFFFAYCVLLIPSPQTDASLPA
jgi:hypothetical protein